MIHAVTDDQNVAFFHDPKAVTYPTVPPFSPSEAYPEYPFKDVASEPTLAYAAVREIFHLLGYDAKHYGTPAWKPLGEIIKPGQKVLIKPNFVRDVPYAGGDLESLRTDGSIIRAVMDYVYIALQGKGRLTVGDAPIQTPTWESIVASSGIDGVMTFFQHETKLELELADFRTEQTIKTYGSFILHHRMIGSADDWIMVDLGSESQLDKPEVNLSRLRVSNYSKQKMQERHDHGKHEYLINRRVLEADVVLNLSKLKTHRLGGLTCSMKNLVGVLAHKSCLAHYTTGAKDRGGDEYNRRTLPKAIFSWLLQQEDSARILGTRFVFFCMRTLFHFITKRGEQVFEGSWYQNDTMWRMVIDLNQAVLYADKHGVLQKTPQRQYFCLVDGLIAGEKDGPLKPTNKPIGVLVAGRNPVAVDHTCAEIMGFDTSLIKTISRAHDLQVHPLITFPLKMAKLPNFHFVPHKNWIGHLERKES